MENLTDMVIDQMDRDELATACKALVNRADNAPDDDYMLREAVDKLSKLIVAFGLEYGEADTCDCGNPIHRIAVPDTPHAGSTYVAFASSHGDHMDIIIEEAGHRHGYRNNGGNGHG